jgi:RHS repeat-associated protein
VFWILAAAIIYFEMPSALAQSPQINNASDLTHAPVPGAGHDYQHLLNENVNFADGSVNIKISFPMPKGRGIGIPIAWSYSSGSVNPLDILDGITPYWYNPAYHAGANRAGWFTWDGLPVATAQVWSVNGNGYDPYTGQIDTSDTWIACNFQSGMTFRDSEGTYHDLSIYAEAPASNPNTGGYIYTCNGSSSFTPFTSPPNGDGQVVGTLVPNTASNFLASDSPQSGAFAVMDKSGTVYTFPGGLNTQSGPSSLLIPGLIEDRNGNTITQEADGSLKDTAGREFYKINSSSSSQTVYSIGGTGDYTANWSTTPVNYTVQSAAGSGTMGGQQIGCISFPTSVGGTRPTLTSLDLPNGQQFTFFYGNTNPNDQTILNSFGLINEIIYPDGGWVKYVWTLPPSGVFNALSEVGGEVTIGPVGQQGLKFQQVPFGCFQQYQVPVLKQRIVSFDGTNIAQTQTFSYSTNWSQSSTGYAVGWSYKSTTVQTKDNIVGKTANTVYTYLPMAAATQKFAPGSIVPQVPMESTISYFDWGKSAPTKIVTKTWQDQFSMTSETTQIVPTNQITEKVFKYGSPTCSTGSINSETQTFNYLLEEDDWDFGLLSAPQAATAPGLAITPPSVAPTKKNVFNYRCFTPNSTTTYSSYSAGSGQFPGLTLPPQVSSVAIESGTGAIQALTQYTYDVPSAPTAFNSSIDPLPIQFDTHYTTSTTQRGNVTKVTRCLAPLPSSPTAACSNSVSVGYTFDPAGLPRTYMDAKGNVTSYAFADSYSDSSPGATDAYLTKITRPGVNHVSTFMYTWATGLLASSTDENKLTTSYTFDSSDRLVNTLYPPDPNNGNIQAYKSISYDDSAPTPSITTDTLTCAQNCNPSSGVTETIQTFDGMAHVTNTSTTDIDNSSGAVNLVQMTYDGEGHVLTATNPYWTTTNGTTRYSYDGFGRKITQSQQDATLLQWCYDGVASVSQTNCYPQVGSVAGTYVDESDENGNDWQRTSDSFGRLLQVQEPSGTSGAPAMETDYTYDILDNLTSVAQFGTSSSVQRTRSFTYDALGRLLTSNNPETGAVSYVYDANGNVSTKTDARNITVTYNYDELNREISRNYSQNGTTTREPSPCHQYDVPLSGATDSYPMNQVTAEWMAPAGACPAVDHPITVIPSSGSTAAYNSRIVLSHDVWGHVTSENQCPTGASCTEPHTFNYSYDLAGGTTQFNNGLTGGSTGVSISGGPLLTFNTALDVTEKVRSVTVANAPWSSPPTLLLADTTMQQKMGTPAYDVWGHLAAEQIGVSSTNSAGLEVVSKYDKRARIMSETAGGLQSAVVPTGSFGVIAVNGIEQSALIPATASVTIGTGYAQDQGPVTWYPCGNQGCPDPEFDQGNITVTVNGNTATVAWGQPSTTSGLASYLASAVNAASSTLGVTAEASGSTVQLTANNPNTAGSAISFSASATDTTPGGVFSSPSFTATASGSKFVGGGGPIYDTGSVTVAITSADNADTYGSTTLATSAPVTWGSTSTDKQLASALLNTITSAASTYLSASLDSSGNSIILTAKGTDSTSLNYGVKVTVNDTTASNNPSLPTFSLPVVSFQFDASSLDGGSNGRATNNYALVYSYAIPEGGYTANSNIQGYSDSVMGDWAFQYDTLNRLTSAVPAPNAPSLYVNTTACWAYDAFGNRTIASFVTSTDCSGASVTSKFDSANHITFVSQTAPISYSAPSGLTYDSGGNVQWDPNNTYAYDSEGRLCAVLQSPLNGAHKYQYSYDASGARVAKATFTGAFPAKNSVCAAPGAETGYQLSNQYLLNLAGELVTELDGTGSWKHTNVWSGAHLNATYDAANGGALHFHLSDPLGTRRVQVDQNGKIEETCQELPFGDQLNCQIAAGAPTTADDATEHHFTGKERDTESGNDYFEARYYSSAMGRFLSPDWSAQEEPVPYAHLDDPQSLNLYRYVLNNPLAKPDLDGHGCPPDCDDPTLPTAVKPPLLERISDATENFLRTPQGFSLVLNLALAALGEDGDSVAVSRETEGTGNVAPRAAPAPAQPAVEPSSPAPASDPPTSIPAGPTPKPTTAQQAKIDEMFKAHGCHECGTRTPGTKSGHAVGDHVPSTSENTSGGPQVYKPHCLRCSLRQGGRIRAAQLKAAAAAKKVATPQ